MGSGAESVSAFHPLVREWFARRFGGPTEPQARGWPRIAAGEDTLIAAPTGSGKTLAAFLFALDRLIRRALAGERSGERPCTSVVYVSPLKALSNDVQKNLTRPLEEIGALASECGTPLPEITVSVRTGDTPAPDRARMAKRSPSILVTTPESLYILLTSEKARENLARVEAVIVDEIHAIADDKRGAHLTLTLERLDALVQARGGGGRPQRIGLSATQKPIETIGQLLVGAGRSMPAIVDAGSSRAIDLAIEVPKDELGAVASHEMMAEVCDRIAALAGQHRTTLVFTNTRRMVERIAHQLAERLGEDQVAAHHGSLSRKTRLRAEQRLKHAEIKVAVATASLELGIDVGAVELVVQLGSPRAIATLLQRVGRSGHSLGATPKGRLFAVTRDQLVECAALVRAVRRGALDAIEIPPAPLDILAQQIVATCAADEWREDELFALVQRAYPYRDLARKDFDRVLAMLSDGVAPARARGSSYLLRDRVHGVVRARRGARLVAITSGGAIPDTADYAVIAEPDETFVGTLHEDFAIESSAGDIFLLGNTSWRIRRVESGRVRVEDAHGAPPTVPFWIGEAPARTPELSEEVGALRAEVETHLARGTPAEAIAAELGPGLGLDRPGAEQLVAHLEAARRVLGVLPTARTIVAERFFDEAGGMQLVIHAPLGGRINRAWGLALRKRFCRSFNFELQAAATDDGLVISLGPMHSFPLETVFEFLSPSTVRAVLEQAVLAAPVFGVRWRWNAQRSLAVVRWAGGKKVPPPLLRMRTDDLLAAVFPMAQACLENIQGDIELPEHPLVEETMRNCLEEAMDVDGLSALLSAGRRGEIRFVARDTAEPSQLAHEILNANPYAYLDDAPLEERRTRAVAMRRRGLVEREPALGLLDPEAIQAAEAEAAPDVRDADELHDLMMSLGILPVRAAPDAWVPWFEALAAGGRAVLARWPGTAAGEAGAWVARERMERVAAAVERPDLAFTPALAPLGALGPGASAGTGGATPRGDVEAEAARVAIVRGHLEVRGPTTAPDLASGLGLPVDAVERALLALEAEGTVLRGRFRPPGCGGPALSAPPSGETPSEETPSGEAGGDLGGGETSPTETPIEWCDRRILARIHRLTLARLRREIEPVTPADLIRFLFRWQHVAPGTQLSGPRGTLEIIAQLEGLEVPAAAWERDVLPLRIADYAPTHLDALAFSGEIAWGRLRVRDATGAPLSRAIPVALMLRDHLPWLLAELPEDEHAPHAGAVVGSSGARDAPQRTSPALGPIATAVLAVLERRGAMFAREIVALAGHLPAEVEDALRDLVYAGLVTADGFGGLRALLDRRLCGEARSSHLDRFARLAGRPGEARGGFDRRYRLTGGTTPAPAASGGGRWSLLRGECTPGSRDETVEACARRLLVRWGVVFRDLALRDPLPWRDVLQALRRMEARGEIRGGRFVSGFVGEQYALPEAVEALRAVRRLPQDPPEVIRIAATDPLNLTGVITPGPRVPAVTGNALLFRNGVPIAAREGGRIVLRAPLEAGESVDLDLRLQAARAG